MNESLAYIFNFGGIIVGLIILWSGIRHNKPRKASQTAERKKLDIATYIQKAFERKNFVFYLTFGIIAGASIGYLTKWPVMGIGIFISSVGGSWLFGSKATRDAHIAKTEAIATWTEMIRDTISGAAGLEEALKATGPLAPAPIAPEVQQFLNRLEYQPLDEALVYLGEILEHPSADLVVVSLANSARLQAQNLGEVLTRLAISIRGDVSMRIRVEVSRSKIITSSKIVVVVSIATIGYLLVFARGLLEPYKSLGGQFWLFIVFGVFWLGGWLLNFYGRIELPERFLSRRKVTERETQEV